MCDYLLITKNININQILKWRKKALANFTLLQFLNEPRMLSKIVPQAEKR